MAIVQISKMQQRAGNLVDLPQLDNGELGWATDANRLFIGRSGNIYSSENVEVLTSYSNISLSQISGSDGANLNFSSAQNGQLMTYVASTNTWENYTGDSSQLDGGKLKLGNVANLSIGGGAAGYILQTDGLGNLSWTTQTGSGGGGNVGGSNTTVQFNDSGLFNGVAAFTFNKLTTTLTVTSGNVNIGNLNATGVVAGTRLFSNIATGTAPLVVSSTTQVANLNAATAGLATFATTANAVAGANVSGQVNYAAVANSVAGANVSGAVANATFATTANAVAGANVSGQVNYAAVANSVAGANVSGAVANATYATTAGTVTTNAQPNITSTGTLTSLTSSGNVTVGSGTTTSAGLQFIPGYASGYFGMFGTGVTPNSTNYSIIIKNDGSVLDLNTTGSIVSKVNNGTITTIDTTGLSVLGGKTLYTTEINTSANTTVGNLTGNWQLTSGSRLTATYADLAEYYEADSEYEPGTVLEFGGDKEVTLANDGTTRVAGVVSTNPAYVMNSACAGIAVAIALQGRVPTKVRGKVHKGDMMISGGDGYARPSISPVMGTVIGKALENFDGIEGVIEVAVGRL